jgi:hypothetical protein
VKSNIESLNIANINGSLREELLIEFPSLKNKLPISGGWGYSIDELIRIEKQHSTIKSKKTFDLIDCEYLVFENRLTLEIMELQRKGVTIYSLDYLIKNQYLLFEDDKKIDKLIFEVRLTVKSNKKDTIKSKQQLITIEVLSEICFVITDFF